MKKLVFVYFILIMFVFSGCGTTKDLRYVSSSYVCNTTIKGSLISPDVYKYFAPSILFNDDQRHYIRLGSVVNQNAEGVFFVDKKLSFLHTPDTVFISSSMIRAVIDSNKYCTYGKLKVNEHANLSLQIYFVKEGEKDTIPRYLEIYSNGKFSFCIDPGIYHVKMILMIISSDEYYYKSIPHFDFSFEVLENRENYIGDIYLLSKDKITKSSIKIPYCKQTIEKNEPSNIGLIPYIINNFSYLLTNDNLAGFFYLDIKNSKCPVMIHSKY